MKSQISEHGTSLGNSATRRSGSLGEPYQTNEISAITKLGFSEVKPPSKKAREVYVDLIQSLQANPEWMDKKSTPSLSIKLFENDPKEVNKFKFQIRKHLDRHNLLVIFHSKQTLSHFCSTVQLSEKVEPDSFWGFLKVSGVVSDKQRASLYKSKVELKGRENKRDSDRKAIRQLINEYYLETWTQKRGDGGGSPDPVPSLIRDKLRKIDETSKTNEAVQLVQNGISPILSEESKGRARD